MEEKFQIAGRALPALVPLALVLAVAGGCSSEGSAFGGGGSSGSGNPGTSGSGQSTGGNGNPTQAMGGNGNPTGVSGGSGGNGNISGSSNPTAGSAGSPAVGGDGPLGGSGSGGSAPEEPCPKPVTAEDPNPICHEFFANDNARNQINYVNEFDPTKNWTKPVDDTTVNSPRQAEWVDNPAASNGKAVMISVNRGYQEYDSVTGERLVNVVLAGVTGIRGAVRLPNGNTLLGVGDNKLRVVDKNGTTVGTECTLPGSGSDSLRVVQRDPSNGHLLLGRLLEIFIVTESCQEQWKATLPAGSKAYSVFPRPGGGVFATSGARSTVVEFDQAGTIVGEVGGKDAHPGIGLDFFSGFERLPNGNVVAANWQGHVAAPAESTPHLVEFTPDNRLVWRWGNQTLARQITNTLILR